MKAKQLISISSAAILLLGLSGVSYAMIKSTGFYKDISAGFLETDHFEVFAPPPATETVECDLIKALKSGSIQIAVKPTGETGIFTPKKEDPIILKGIVPQIDPYDHHPYIGLKFLASWDLQGVDSEKGHEVIYCSIYEDQK